MNANWFKVWRIGVLFIWCGVFTNETAEAQVNSWVNPASGTWNWATPTNWSTNAPSINQSAIFITNTVTAPPSEHLRSVTIDSTTVNQPATLTVSNVTVSGPKVGLISHFNTLFLNTGGSATPLHILSSLIISNGGTVSITNSVLLVDSVVADNGFLLLNTGTLITTNGYFNVGNGNFGQMTVSDGTWRGSAVFVGDQGGSQGILTLAGGTNILSYLAITGTGVVSVTGGQFISAEIGVGYFGAGQMTVSGGTCLANNLNVGTTYPYLFGKARGTLTLAGGTTIITGTPSQRGLNIADDTSTTGTVWVTGGQLITTNASVNIAGNFFSVGQLTVSNGTWHARDVTVGYGFDSQGTLTFAGGITTVSSNLVVGECGYSAPALVRVASGTLYVTNASHTASIDLRNGTFTVNGAGSVVVDVMVITNACGEFVRSGGLFTYRTAILDLDMDADGDSLPNGWEQMHGLDPFDPVGDNGPFGDPDGDGYNNYEEYLAGSDPRDPLSTPGQITSPFRFTSIARQGNNIVLMWTTAGGTTNQVQVSSGGSGGSYSTNGFNNLGAQLFIPGSGIVTTNYTDTGGATNRPARYYRIRLVP